MQRIYNQMIVGTGGNYLKYDADDRWTPENTNATKPRAFERVEEYWRSDYESDYLFSRTDFARLKNLQLSYRLPRDLQNQLKLRNAKVFVAGQNLFMIYSGHKVDSMDPERGGTGSYPIMSVLSIGAEVTF
jgi:TonB-dependent starch-binding outer membrane protein SusC